MVQECYNHDSITNLLNITGFRIQYNIVIPSKSRLILQAVFVWGFTVNTTRKILSIVLNTLLGMGTLFLTDWNNL